MTSEPPDRAVILVEGYPYQRRDDRPTDLPEYRWFGTAGGNSWEHLDQLGAVEIWRPGQPIGPFLPNDDLIAVFNEAHDAAVSKPDHHDPEPSDRRATRLALAAVMEQLRHQADSAVLWGVNCTECAKRLDESYESYTQGWLEGVLAGWEARKTGAITDEVRRIIGPQRIDETEPS